MKAVAVNTSPRTNWNTALLVKEAARGAESAGAEVRYFDLYRQEPFTGCVSCFGCKRKPNEGYCVLRDGLLPILEAIREADAVIIGTPNYLGEPSAGFRALYERLIFQNITYQKESFGYHPPHGKGLFIMTSNAPAQAYAEGSRYAEMVETNRLGLERVLGPTEVLLSTDTLQVDDYSIYNWTAFDPEAKKARREAVFPEELKKAFETGARLGGRL